MTGLALDLRITLRSLLKTPGILAISLLAIALGVGVNTAMFSVVNAVLLRPLPYPEPERIVALWPEKRWSAAMLNDVRERVGSHEAVAAYRTETYMLLGQDAPEAIPVAVVSPSYFTVLRSSPIAGRAFREGDEVRAEGPVVVLSHALFERRFGGDRNIVGTRIRLAGGGAESRTVIGIMPADFTSIPAQAEAWVPLVDQGQPGFFGGYGFSVIGRLAPGASVTRASAELRRLVPELTPLHPSQFRPIRYSPVDVVQQLEMMTRGIRTKLFVLLGAVVFILLIACTNVANLLLARAHGRQREVAVQVAIGCSNARILRQVLLEGVLVGLAGGVIGLYAAMVALPVIRSFAGSYIPRTASISVDATVLGYALLLSLVTGILFGALPALRAAATSPGDIMRATAGRGQSQGRKASRVSDLFVITEIAVSLLLLVGSGLMLKSLWQLTRVDLGFSPDRVLAMQVILPPGSRYDSLSARAALLRDIETRIDALPGVERVGTIDILPFSGSNSGFPYQVLGQTEPAGTSLVVNTRVVTPDYFETLRIPLLRGRMFGASDIPTSDSTAPLPILANEAFANLHWPEGSAIGGRIQTAGGGFTGEIVGITRNARQISVAGEPDPEIYLAASQNGWNGGYLLVRGERDVPSQRPILDALQSIDRDLGVRNVRSMDDVVHAGANDTRFYTRLLTAFALLALILGVVGVYGVMAHATSRRTREFGVRLALGATPRDVLGFVLTRALVPVSIGLAIGAAGAVGLTRLIESLLYGVSARDPWVLVGGMLFLGASAIVAALIPALRASRLSPLEALRDD